MRRVLSSVLWLCLLCAGGCREHRPVGAACSSDRDCDSEMCVMEMFLGATCKARCGTDEHCPVGERCTGRAEGNVPYCEPAYEE